MAAWSLQGCFLVFVKEVYSQASSPTCKSNTDTKIIDSLYVLISRSAFWYQRHDMVFRIGLFYCAAPLSGAFGGVLASGLSQIKSGGYNRWPWIFCAYFGLPFTLLEQPGKRG